MNRRRRCAIGAPGFTVLELLVLISVIGLLLALLLPAVQASRESGRRTQCMNNLRQQGVALHQFIEVRGKLPSGGMGTDPSKTPPETAVELQSTFSQLMPYIEETYLAADAKGAYAYNDAACPANQTFAKVAVVNFLCPTVPIRQPDPNDYGLTDYMPTVYCDIDPGSGIRNPASRMNGALKLGCTPIAAIIDGMSRTIAIAESAGRSFENEPPNTTSPYADPVFSGGTSLIWSGSAQVTYSQWCAANNIASGGAPPGDIVPPSKRLVMNRWASPGSGGGISGQANSTVAKIVPAVNGNSSPPGGPPNCPWSQTDCGPNDEIWSWHSGGANVLMCDGAVRSLGSSVDPRVLRKLVTASEQSPYGDNEVPD